MTVKALLIYCADNGKEFTNEEDCRNYERELNEKRLNDAVARVTYKMYDKAGNEVKDCRDCYFVYLATPKDAETFVNLNQAYDLNSRGIYPGDIGLFMWDENCEVWFYISPAILSALIALEPQVYHEVF